MVELKSIESQNEYGEPQRILKYILIYCIRGNAEILIDENIFQLNENEVITITSGQYHQLRPINGKVFKLAFTLDFFCKNDNDIELIFHNGLFCHFGMNEVIAIKNPSIFQELLLNINNEIIHKPYQYLISLHSSIELLLVQINRSKVARGDEIWKPDALFLKFLDTVRVNFSSNISLSKIADKLSTTEAKLNELSKLHTNKTAQNVMYSLIISEAKRLLIYQNLTIKEIAYQLGFTDPFYFSNFFKKHSGKSPKDYRKLFAV